MTRLATFASLSPTAADLREAARLLQDDANPLDGFARAAQRLTGAGYAALWEPESEDTAVCTAVAGDGPRLGQRMPRGRSNAPAQVLRTRERLVALEARGHAWVDQALVRRLRLRSLLCEPIVRGDEAVGALALGWREPLAELDDMGLGFLALLCAQAAVAIERARLATALREQARTDQLTGLPNRRALGEALLHEMARARRTGGRLGLAVLDLDHFKRINDVEGHLAGDAVLRRAARAWSGQLRDADVLTRYGGEEFVVVLPDVPSVEQAAIAVERIRRATPAPTTASAGVALWDGAEDPASLLARADAALYRAKANGRNRLELG